MACLRFAQGRGGAGRVFRDKRIAAIVCRFTDMGGDKNGVADMAVVRKAGQRINKEIADLDDSQNQMRKIGTANIVDVMDHFDLLPTHNFRFGSHPDTHKIDSKVWKEAFTQGLPDGCWLGCTMSSSHGVDRFPIQTGPYAGTCVLVGGPKYENAAGLGSNIGNFDPQKVLELNFYCDTYGIDTISVANCIAFAMEEVIYSPADLSMPEKICEMVAFARDVLSPIDILVNNAGIIRRNPSVDFTEKDWDEVIDINLKTLFFLSQAVARQFLKQGSGGKIINIASMLSFQGGILVPSYTASKSGVMGLTRLLASEWAPHGINVNAIAPGYMATRNTQAIQDVPVRSRQILERIPAGRWGQPEDLAGTVVFLSSCASDYLHGSVIAVDGGWLER